MAGTVGLSSSVGHGLYSISTACSYITLLNGNSIEITIFGSAHGHTPSELWVCHTTPLRNCVCVSHKPHFTPHSPVIEL